MLGEGTQISRLRGKRREVSKHEAPTGTGEHVHTGDAGAGIRLLVGNEVGLIPDPVGHPQQAVFEPLQFAQRLLEIGLRQAQPSPGLRRLVLRLADVRWGDIGNRGQRQR